MCLAQGLIELADLDCVRLRRLAMDKMYFFLFGMAMVQGLNTTIGFPSYKNEYTECGITTWHKVSRINGLIDPKGIASRWDLLAPSKTVFGIDGPCDNFGNNKTPVVGEYRSLMSVTALNPSHIYIYVFFTVKSMGPCRDRDQ